MAHPNPRECMPTFPIPSRGPAPSRPSSARERPVACVILALLVAVAIPATGSAQMWPGIPGQEPCGVAVAFEPIGVHGLLPMTNAYHAVVVLYAGGNPVTAFEGNPTGNAVNWGWLTIRQRELGASGRGLRSGTIVEQAGGNGMSCPQMVTRLRQMMAQINRAHLPYFPTPELKWNAVNSNSFAFWAISRLNLQPPIPPNGWTSGETPGYYAAISGGDN
jgi:hypothetical protein